MIEAKYFKDYKHNYLILKCEGAKTGETYQYRMLASNKIDKVLRCTVRNVNGETYFYYDISSKVTLENLYQGRKMSYEQVKDFLWQMNVIYRNLGQFFMEETKLLIQPGCIYYDFTSRQYYGLYYPAESIQNENSYEPLMDFLINHVETGNAKLVDIIYRIYEMSEEQFFSLSDALSLFEEEDESIAAEESAVEGRLIKEENIEEEYVPEADSLFPQEYSDNEGESTGKKREVNIPSTQKKNSVFYGIFALLSLCGIGAALWIYLHYELTQQELMVLVCCLALMGLCFLFSVVQLALSGRKIRKKEQEDKELLYDIEDEFRDERPIALQGVLDRNMSPIARQEVSGKKMNPQADGNHSAGKKDAEEQYGETVFVNVQKQKMEYKLYALDKKNKKHIELTQFPFSIGKMAGCVDCVLADDSISRLHARIEKEDEKILLTDMNSTNGTYKNGLRMEPSETVEIEPGDEIRFGKLNYCYR